MIFEIFRLIFRIFPKHFSKFYEMNLKIHRNNPRNFLKFFKKFFNIILKYFINISWNFQKYFWQFPKFSKIIFEIFRNDLILKIPRNNSQNDPKYFFISSKLLLEIILPNFYLIVLKISHIFLENYTTFVLKIFSKISKKLIFEYLPIPILNRNWKTYEWQYLTNVTEVILRT